MKSVIALMIGLMAAGVAAAYSDFSLTAPSALQSYLSSASESSTFQILLAGIVLILLVGFREQQELIDRKTREADESAKSSPVSSRRNPIA